MTFELDKHVGEVFKLATSEAKSHNFDFIGLGHVLVAMLKMCVYLNEQAKERNIDNKEIRAAIRMRLGEGDAPKNVEPKPSVRVNRMLERASALAGDGQSVDMKSLLLSLLEENDVMITEVSKALGLDRDEIRLMAKERIDGGEEGARAAARAANRTPMLDQLGRDLTEDARKGKLHGVVGRDELLKQVMVSLSRQSKPNVLLVGEAGVGKTAVVEGLALRISEGKVPPAFANLRVVALEPSAINAGASLVGETERRLRMVIEEVKQAENILLFLDEMHTLMGVGTSAMNAGDILKPALARGDMRVVGATTPAECNRFLERDSALFRRFERVDVPEPSAVETLSILRDRKASLEKHHGVTIEDAAISSAVDLSIRYVTQRFLPDKAIDLVDEACGRLRLSTLETDPQKLIITRKEIIEIVAKRAGVPLEVLSVQERTNLAKLQDVVEERVFGQSDAVSAVCKAVQAYRLGLKSKTRPVGVFLLTGPSGVGKTLLAQTIADFAFGPGSLMRIDLTEYQHSHEISKLIGSPPGFVGHGQDGVLSGWLRRKPHSVVLFDEADKASDSVFDLMLQLLDEGRITNGRGETIDASQALFLLTSNHLAGDLLPGKRVGFAAAAEPNVRDQKSAMNALKDKFRPEFLGRLDSVLPMKPLDEKAFLTIAKASLKQAEERLSSAGVHLRYETHVIDTLAKSGSATLGARPIRARVESEVIQAATNTLLNNPTAAMLELIVTESGALDLKALEGTS